MLKKKLGINAIEMKCDLVSYFKIPSTLVIPEGCKWIGVHSFSGCRKLKKVIIPESVEWIASFAFRDCNNATIILKKPKSEFEYFGSWALDDCKEIIEDVKEEIRN